MTSTVFVDEQTVIRASWLNDVNADVYGVRPVSTGGTGASDAATARTNLGLGNVDNTSDADKPVSTATQTALNLKFDKSGGTVTGNMTVTGNAALGDAEATDTHAIKGATTVLANSASAALTVTQTGAGNAFVVEDSASTDSTPFVITGGGRIIQGNTTEIPIGAISNQNLQLHGNPTLGLQNLSEVTWYSGAAISGIHSFARSKSDTIGTHAIVASGDELHTLAFWGSDGTAFIRAAHIKAEVDGTPGTNDMPGRLVFSTTADGASSPTERMRIDSTGAVGISTALPQVSLYNTRNISGNVTSYGFYEQATVQSDVTSAAFGYRSNLSTAAAAFTLASHYNYYAGQGTIGAGSAITNQYGFVADATITGATNNYGFYGNIAAGTNRYNFYAAGTADNYFAGKVGIGAGPAATTTLMVSKQITGGAIAYGVYVDSPIDGSTSTTQACYFQTAASISAGSTATFNHYATHQGTLTGTVGTQIGYNANASLTGATNNYGFYGNIAAGTNRWNFYASGTANNAYAGNSSFGKVTAPTSAVDTTSFGTNLVTNTAGTYTVLVTDGTIVQTTAASTYTLPSAASFPGRILKLLTQFAGTVVSASSNVVPIAGGAAGTAILAATAGKYAVLQSNGTNWLITEAN